MCTESLIMNTVVQALPIYVQHDVQLGPLDAQMLKEVFEKGGRQEEAVRCLAIEAVHSLTGERERSTWDFPGDPKFRVLFEVLFYLQLTLVSPEPLLDLWRGASEASGYLHWTCLLCTLQFLEHSFNKHQMPGLLQTCSPSLSPQLCDKLSLSLTTLKFPHLSSEAVSTNYLHSCLTANE